MTEDTTPVCGMHSELVETLAVLTADIKWLVRIGKWLLALMGACLILVIPIGVTVISYFSAVNARLATIDIRVIALEVAKVEATADRKDIREDLQEAIKETKTLIQTMHQQGGK